MKIHVAKGSVEALPYPDKKFDAAVAVWILHYVQDLEQSLREMVRVVDPTAPNACLVVVQGAPDNEVVKFINETCRPIAGEPIDHQGYLLSVAIRIFTESGFGDIKLDDAELSYATPEADLGMRCSYAADVLTNIWYDKHPKSEAMRTARLSNATLKAVQSRLVTAASF